MVEITKDNFESEVLKSTRPVIIDLWAEWCMPCRMLEPVIGEIAKEYNGKLKVCKLNVDEAPTTAAEYNIMSIPTLVVFKNGTVADKTVGVVPKADLVSKISSHMQD